jgi:hypothetical protein
MAVDLTVVKGAANPASTLLQQRQDYLAGWKRRRKPTVVCACPHCGKDIENPRPSDPKEQWDSLMTCPYCEEFFMAVKRGNGTATFRTLDGIETQGGKAK